VRENNGGYMGWMIGSSIPACGWGSYGAWGGDGGAGGADAAGADDGGQSDVGGG